ncbi:T9SS type A sorting domain-containing protein [Belliella sp. R4-6]|uniref:T9SS type A sorting domain-containing protein n=1 Tax=Belliella alkalica TaxID=1730871 RepID=A0ABS9VGP1_9BACT|nr:T9SS type A sorting domain-containing protein [Belliella alkalica]
MKIIDSKYYLTFLIFVTLCASQREILAQNARVYAENIAWGRSSFLAGSVSNLPRAHDSDPNLYATLNVSLGLGNSVWIAPIFDHTVVAGTPVRIKVGKSPGLLDLASSVTIRAFLGGTVVSTSINLGSLVGLLSGREISEVIFTPVNASGVPVSYDRIEIRLTGLLSLGLSFDVFDVYYLSDELSVCESVKDYLYGSTSGLLGGLNPVINPQRAFDGDLSTYAELLSALSVGNKTHLTALFDDPSRSGDSIHVVLKNPSGLLDLSLLTEQFSIKTFMDNTLVENMISLESFLSLSLLPGESDVYKLSFPTIGSFNRIEVSLEAGLLNALGSLQVFDISKTEHSANIEIVDEDSHIFCVGESLILQQDVIYSGDSYEWKIGDEILSEDATFGLPNDLPAGEYHIELYTYREGCINATEASSISITLIDVPDKELIDVYPSGEAKRDGDYFVYYEGLNPITLSPVYNDPNLLGEFSWYLDEALTTPIYDGMIDYDGTTYKIDENNALTINDWIFRDPDIYRFFLAYTNELGCLDVKPFDFEAVFVILPQGITNFMTQIKNNSQVHISWNSEVGNGFFELLRAQEDLNFYTISTLPITTGSSYEFIDSLPKSVNYYKVVHKDFEQNHLYHSSLLRVKLSQIAEYNNVINVFPNPFVSELHILSNAELGADVLIKITAADGKIVVSEKINNWDSRREFVVEDLFYLPKGAYILQIIDQNQMFTFKILK